MASRSRFDPQPPDKGALDSGSLSKQPKATSTNNTMALEAGEPEGINLLHLIGTAERISKDYQSKTVERPLARAYRAWQNQHAEGSKYLGTAWKGRSRLFVPKTRSAVRKNLATAAGALFSTEDVVNLSATFEDDPQQRATAAVIKADMDFRLTRASTRSGIPWFQIAMGGCMDGQLTGCTISKQFWEYEEVITGSRLVDRPLTDEETGEPLMDYVRDPETDEPILDPETGEYVLEPITVQETEPIIRVVKDRPMVDLVPIENIGVDPAAPWYDPVQLGRWYYARYPMGLSDVRAMMASGAKPDGANPGPDTGWLQDVPDELLLKGRIEEDRSGSRRVREGGTDRYMDSKSPGDLDIVWIQENFIRIDGVDWHFWSIGRHGYISKVRPVYEAYPEFDGERPYVFGVSQIDTHRVFPMSPVESWQPLQLELNDITNLRQDTLKRAIAPLAKVKRGTNVDLTQVQRRGQPDAMLLVNSMDDVAFEQTPGPSGAAYTETSVNNSMFDELAGVFSTSSVQSNRQLNETVGGMRMMSGAANAVSEFDLRMWVETWVERVLRQVAHLIRYHESDEKILALAGQRARVWQRYQYMPSLSDFDQCEMTLRVNCGVGALDPMQRLAKLKMAGEMIAPMMPIMQAQGITPDPEAFIEEVFGHAGFKDGRRFFKFGEPPQDKDPPPEVQQFMAEMELKQKALEAKLQETEMRLRSEEARNHEDNVTAVRVAQIRSKTDIVKAATSVHQAREDRAHSMASAGEARRQKIHEILAGKAADAMTQRQEEAEAPARASRGSDTGASSQALMSALGQMKQRQDSIENALKAIVQHMMQGAPRSPMGGMPGMGQSPMGNPQIA